MSFRRLNRDRTVNRAAEDIKEKPADSVLSTSILREMLGPSSDVVFREFFEHTGSKMQITMAYIDGLIDSKQVDDYILKPLFQLVQCNPEQNSCELLAQIERGVLYHLSQKTREKAEDCISDILDGSVAFIFDMEGKAVTFDVNGYESRSITEPTGENVIKGALDSFVENIRINTATIRRKIRNHSLTIEETTIGKQSNTKAAIVYMRDIANTHILDEARKRLSGINTDCVLSLGIIEENMSDNKYSTFPQLITTVRPDKFCSNIIEGRIGLIFDGFPVAYIIPGTFASFLQAPEDYSQNFIISSIIRSLRYILTLVTLFIPGFYVSITTFHQEMIPTELALAITASKEGVPFPSFVEVILMLIVFEILVEAGVRLPKTIGQAVSIVGAVVVGQAAVQAKLVSPAVVVIIAITAIASFTMPNQDFSNALRLWRFVLVIASSIIGLFGLTLGAIILLDHLTSLETYGIPYLAPFTGEDAKQLQDSVFRLPFSSLYKRPVGLKVKNKRRTE